MRITTTFRAAVLGVALLLPAAGCAPLRNAWEVTTSATVSPTAVYVAVNTFDALKVTATNYLRLRRCSPTSGPVCRSPAATAQIIPAINSGTIARNNLRAFLRNHPNQIGPSGPYDALQATIETLRGIYQQYNIEGGTP